VVVTSPTLVLPSGRSDAVVVPPPRAPRPPLPRAQARAVLAGRGLDAVDPRPVFAVVGRLVRYKGVEDAVRALAYPGGVGWRLAVIGDSDPAESGEGERLRQLAVEEGVADRVVFLGPVRDAASLLTGVDAVGVLTKPTATGPGREGFACVATEAMLAGVPVVATSGGPVVDRLAGRAGLGVPPGDPAAVALALGRLADGHRRRAMGAAGRRLSAHHPDAATCAQALTNVLARVACRPGAGRLDGPAISVITTVLNEADVVDRLLRQLTAQLTEAGDEIVVVDGGSRDSTVAQVRAWVDRDSRVRLLVLPGT
jgi:glycosyltransferase involved in cell wall biosynthesis